MTESEDARVAMLLEGNDVALGQNVELIGNSPLPDEFYGGREEAFKLREIDRRLKEKGYCDYFGDVAGEGCRNDASFNSRRERVFVDLAEQRLERKTTSHQRCVETTGVLPSLYCRLSRLQWNGTK